MLLLVAVGLIMFPQSLFLEHTFDSSIDYIMIPALCATSSTSSYRYAIDRLVEMGCRRALLQGFFDFSLPLSPELTSKTTTKRSRGHHPGLSAHLLGLILI